jgi:AIG2-like family
MDAILVPISPAWPPLYRAAQRRNLVLRLWRQYARQRLSQLARLASSRVARGPDRGYKLRFNLKAPPRGTITYANLSADPNAEVWGVLYKITRRDLVRLEATEGVPWWRYRPLWLDAEDLGGTALKAATLLAQGDKNDSAPSLRYLTLLREGARAHGLPKHYIRFLEQIEHLR